MKIKSLCFKYGDVWFTFCHKCGAIRRDEVINGDTSLRLLLNHLKSCTESTYNTTPLYHWGIINEIRNMKYERNKNARTV